MLKVLEIFADRTMKPAVFWVVKPCSVVVAYQRFGKPCCLRFQGGGCYRLFLTDLLSNTVIMSIKVTTGSRVHMILDRAKTGIGCSNPV